MQLRAVSALLPSGCLGTSPASVTAAGEMRPAAAVTGLRLLRDSPQLKHLPAGEQISAALCTISREWVLAAPCRTTGSRA